MTSQIYQRIYSAARLIPFGKVATYGQIALLAGIPGHARQVGYAMHALPDDSDIPWHRVINAKGEISIRNDPLFADIQKLLLEHEGIVFDLNNRVNLSKYQWQPENNFLF